MEAKNIGRRGAAGLLSALTIMLCTAGCASSPTTTIDFEPPQSSLTTNQTDKEGAVDSVSSENDTFEIGVVDGQVYKNGYLGIVCELPDDWQFYSEDDLAAINGLRQGTGKEEAEAALQNSAYIYDMMATSSDGAKSMNIIIEKMDMLYGEELTEEAFASASAAEAERAYTDMGYDEFACEMREVAFMGERHVANVMFAELPDDQGGRPVYQVQIFKRVGGRMASVSICTYGEDLTAEAMLYFN